MRLDALLHTVRQAAAAALVAAMLLVAGLFALGLLRGHPEALPWTRLDLAQPIGAFTGRKLAMLGKDAGKCDALLDAAGIGYRRLAPVVDGQCGYADGVRLTGGAQRIAYTPAGLGTSCAVAAALAMWEWNVVQPAAQRYLGADVVGIDHFGSYNCRRIRGTGEGGSWSEHAHANAVDIAGFRLSDGTRITVARDWKGDGARATFLHAVRNGACRLFATTLSPDYNAAHHDHLHLDQAMRGGFAWSACR